MPREEQGKAALTELFEALKGDETPIIVENVVSRIDEVVRGVRFEGWQTTIGGGQEVRQALRKTLYVQFEIRDDDVFEKALGYVRGPLLMGVPTGSGAGCCVVPDDGPESITDSVGTR